MESLPGYDTWLTTAPESTITCKCESWCECDDTCACETYCLCVPDEPDWDSMPGGYDWD